MQQRTHPGVPKAVGRAWVPPEAVQRAPGCAPGPWYTSLFPKHPSFLYVPFTIITDLSLFSADTAARVAAEHQLELEKERANSTRLQQELEQAKIEKAELEKTLADAARTQGEVLEQIESRATLAEQKLNALKSQCDLWLAELKKINAQMDSEFLQTFTPSCPTLLPTFTLYWPAF